MNDMTAQIPVAEGLFAGSGPSANLIGSRCRGCGSHYFPRSLSCRNPHCPAKDVAEVLLSRRGRLYSFTLQGYRPPPLFKMDSWSPYVIGSVELPEGLRVMGMLTGTAHDDIRIGMAVDLVIEPLYRDESGRDVMTYKFKPIMENGDAS
jgi:uncharacterized OB-fold protein